MALWGGFILETAKGPVYCVGDTGYGDGKIFRRIRERFGPPIVAAVPIGACAPRWFIKEQHTDPADAVRLRGDGGALALLGIHWGTFALTDEPYDEPAALFKSIAFSSGYMPETAVAFRPVRCGPQPTCHILELGPDDDPRECSRALLSKRSCTL